MPTAKPAVSEVLRRVPIFTDLSDTELTFLSERAVPRKYAPGELLFHEGDPCAGLFVIETGNVRIFFRQKAHLYVARNFKLFRHPLTFADSLNMGRSGIGSESEFLVAD